MAQYHHFTVDTSSSPRMNSLGRQTCESIMATGVMMMVLITKTPFKAFSTSGSSFTGYSLSTTRSVNSPAMMPVEEISTGYINEAQLGESSLQAETSTNAAQVDSAKDPKRSAPIPAMSPTLSPTLSAIVPGFIGESSSSPCVTFPARSAPTSAAFV